MTPPSHLWTAETQQQVEASQVIVEHEALAVVLSAGDKNPGGNTQKDVENQGVVRFGTSSSGGCVPPLQTVTGGYIHFFPRYKIRRILLQRL